MLIAYIYTRFTPLWDWTNNIINNDNKPTWFSLLKNGIAHSLNNKLTNCFACLSFWMVGIITHSIYIGIVAYIIANYYEKRLSYWEDEIKLKK